MSMRRGHGRQRRFVAGRVPCCLRGCFRRRCNHGAEDKRRKQHSSAADDDTGRNSRRCGILPRQYGGAGSSTSLRDAVPPWDYVARRGTCNCYGGRHRSRMASRERHDERGGFVCHADERSACRELACPRRGVVVREQQHRLRTTSDLNLMPMELHVSGNLTMYYNREQILNFKLWRKQDEWHV